MFTVYCNLPTDYDKQHSDDQKPDISSFPTHFDSLESNIIYFQGNQIIYFNKEVQTREILEFPNFIHNPQMVKWSFDDNSIYFIDSYGEDYLYKYNFGERTALRISDKNDIFLYELSPNGNKILLSTGDWGRQQYYFNETNNITIDLNEFNQSIFDSDSMISDNLHFISLQWINEHQFSYLTFPSYLQADSSIIYYNSEVIVNVNENLLSIVNIINHTKDKKIVTWNKERTFGYYKDNYSVPYFVDNIKSDTIKISEKGSEHISFSPNQDLILYNQQVSAGIDIFIGSSVYNYYVYNVNTRTSTKLFPDAYDVHSVSFSESQNQIVCGADYYKSDYFYNIWIMNLDGSNSTIISDTLFVNKYPKFKPN